MKITVDESIFISAFDDMGRGNQFSTEALQALFDYYDEIDADMELDVIAICCDWCEYSNDDLVYEYGYLIDDDGETPEFIQILEELEERTCVIRLEDSVLVLAF